jgi:hypothetical protein
VRHDQPVSRHEPASHRTPGRLPRILLPWTGVLTILVVTQMRTLPPSLVGLVLPYLALVGWHLLVANRHRQDEPRTIRAESQSPQNSCSQPDIIVGSPPEVLVDPVEAPKSTVPVPAGVGSPGSPGVQPRQVRGRRRRKPTHVPAPVAVPWVQVGPGRFVRGEEPDPALPDHVEDGIDAVAAEVGQPPITLAEGQTRTLEAGVSPDAAVATPVIRDREFTTTIPVESSGVRGDRLRDSLTLEGEGAGSPAV